MYRTVGSRNLTSCLMQHVNLCYRQRRARTISRILSMCLIHSTSQCVMLQTEMIISLIELNAHITGYSLQVSNNLRIIQINASLHKNISLYNKI
nr:MAG TPA: hypothetical protein [Caudoviricetes sp.]